MRRTYLPACWCAVMVLALATRGAESQETVPVRMDPPTATGDSVGEGKAVRKKGGLFGKVKGLAGNKVVKAVAKTAACSMVPGGQVIAGAIDAAGSDGAGSAADGVAGGAVGAPCMPGAMSRPDAAGLKASGLSGMAVQAGAAAATAGRSPQVPSPVTAPGDGSDGVMGYEAGTGMSSPEELAECLGLSLDEFESLTDPTGGEPRTLTPDEIERQSALAKKVDMRAYQACMMPRAAGQIH
jgi:hypothetical protein